MPLFKHLRHLKRPAVQASAQSGLQTSAALPNSGFAFVDNSQGASAAIVELAGSLDVAFEQLDLGKEPDDQRRLQLDRLSEEAAKYSNCKLGAAAGEEWTCLLGEAELISSACACSSTVYDQADDPQSPGLKFNRIAYVEPSTGGTVKATASWAVERTNPDGGSSWPVLVIAVRGTASVLDRLVNLNGKRADASSILDFRGLSDADEVAEPIYAHAGFMNGAKALIHAVSKQISDAVTSNKRIKHVLFTGHSAGGAVASLLFGHFLSVGKQQYPSARFSLVTFGAPPVTRPDLTPRLLRISRRQGNVGLMLAIVNEYDVVSRADGPYIRSLVDLYRSRYGLPPVNDEASSVPEYRGSLEDPSSKGTFQENSDPHNSLYLKREWPLPMPEYYLIGQIIVLRTSLESLTNTPDSDKDIADSCGEPTANSVLKALKVTPDELSKVIYCNTDVHRRMYYCKRVEMILGGRLNKNHGWENVDTGAAEGNNADEEKGKSMGEMTGKPGE